MLLDVSFIETFDTDISFKSIFSAWQFKMVCNEEKRHFFNFNTDSRISLCAMSHYHVEGRHQGHRIAFSDFLKFVLVRKKIRFCLI